MKKIFSFLLLTLLLSIGVNAWGAKISGSYTITFKTGSGDGSGLSTSTSAASIISDGDEYVSGNLAAASNVYSGGDYLKLGKSGASGSIKINLSDAGKVYATTIVVRAKQYNSNSSTVQANGKAAQTVSSSSFANYSFTINANITYIQLQSNKYQWIESVTVNYEAEVHTATFHINGASSSGLFTEGLIVSFPDVPVNIGGKAFAGWKKGSAIDGITDVAPTLVAKASETMGKSDVDYYAVYGFATPTTVDKTDELTMSTTGVSGTTYTAWSGKSATNGSDAIYSGCSAGSNSSIQLNASTNTSKRGIISTTSGGKLKKVTVEWYSGTSNGRSITIYGSNSAYTTMSAFDGSKGTSLGTITKNTSTELSISGDYKYIGIYATEALYMKKLSIEWEAPSVTYTAYCTTVAVEGTISAAGWSTFASEYNLDLSQITGGEAYYASAANANSVTLKKTDAILEAGKGIMIKGDADDVFTIKVTNEDATLLETNYLVGQTTTGNVTASGTDGKYHYVFGFKMPESVVTEYGFYKLTEDTEVAAGKAYLETTSDISPVAGAPTAIRIEDEEYNATDIQSIESTDKAIKFFDGGKLLIMRDGIVYDALGRVIR